MTAEDCGGSAFAVKDEGCDGGGDTEATVSDGVVFSSGRSCKMVIVEGLYSL